MRIYVLDGGGPKDSENTLNSFLTKRGEKVFWQIGTDMTNFLVYLHYAQCFLEACCFDNR